MNIIKNIIENKYFVTFITTVIIINAITLGLETSKNIKTEFGVYLSLIDTIALTIFTIELLAKITVYKLRFFRDGWNIFDFIIVVVSLIPASGPFSVLRAFRIFRTLRLLSIVPSMKRIIQAIFISIPGILSVGTIIVLIFYISSVLTTTFLETNFMSGLVQLEVYVYTISNYDFRKLVNGNCEACNERISISMVIFCTLHSRYNICSTKFVYRNNC